MLTQAERAKKTYLYDCIRGPFNSIVFQGLMTLALLIAIRYHEAPSWVKSIISSGESLGRAITPITLYLGFRLALPTARLASMYMLATALFLLVTAFASSLAVYTIGIVLAYILFAQPLQLMLQIYSKNYTADERGSRVSTMFVISLIVGSIFARFFGKWLDIDIQHFQWQFVILGISAAISAYFLAKIPSTPLDSQACGNPWQNFSLIWKDKLFGWMIIAYIILGIGTAMVIPIKIEYMANPTFKINASNLNITLINVIIPAISMIISTKLWGYIFDKINFIKTRLLVNACFIASFLTFFTSTNIIILGISSVLNGIALSGGMLVWNLWVTKIAPNEKVPAYMSAHSATSGLKGLIAPATGYAVLSYKDPITVGIVAAILMILSCIMFYAVRNNPQIK